MKKWFYLLLVIWAVPMFVACSDNDDKDAFPINGLEIPRMENPITPGQKVTIKGEGFTIASEIWFRQASTKAIDNHDVKAEIINVEATGIVFIAPSVYGDQIVLLKQGGREYKLGEMVFAEQLEESEDVDILPKRIKKVLEYNVNTRSEDKTSREYEYGADGKIKLCKWMYGRMDIYTYSNNEIIIMSDGYVDTFVVEDDHIKSYQSVDNIKHFQENAVLEYNGLHLAQVKLTDSNGNSGTEFFLFDEGRLLNYSYSYDSDNYGNIEFTYGEQLNNLNIDLFYFIGSLYFDSCVSETFQFGMTGKRSNYLPVGMKVTAPIWDKEKGIIGNETYTATIEYEMSGDYITRFTIKEIYKDGREWSYFFVIEYEE